MKNQTVVVIGANSEIAKGIAEHFIENAFIQLIVISRNTDLYQQDIFDKAEVIKVNDYQEDTISKVANQLQNSTDRLFTHVFICHGLLHTKTLRPEKRLEDFSPTAFNQVLTVNTITPMLWLKYLTPQLSGKHACKVVIFSARVGSITDNRLGGWYSYRASKAAMNMLIKSASIELARRAKNVKLISFHPGTTDSPLSKPFQYNVPKGKLFTRNFVAERVIKVVDDLTVDGQASFVDWQGQDIPW
ncbi:SDR family NAD(P)-dependent oxidoreductase [Paraglaciecola sp.]|uniref:SDR family NAD(P)-dependent oxidoreductase n=1 Tax=Paraglaciecola sp. TaxID=1920173 RepID=UPI003EFA579D